MTYFIFLKYLRSLEEFRKNPHVKIPPKSPCANFQNLGIFKNQILFGKEFSSLSAQLAQQPTGPSGLSAQPQPFFSFPTGRTPSSPLGLSLSAGPAHLPAQPATFFLLPQWSPMHKVPPPVGLAPPPRSTTTPPPEEKKWPHQSPFISPLIGAIPPLQSPVTSAFNKGPLKLLQHQPLKALGLPRLASAL
jgi:hypothetical protein